jgi:regulator of nucleoside diphosphate kinase
MKYGSLIFEKMDFLMVRKYRESNPTLEDYAHRNLLDILEQNMSEAILYDAYDIPTDIIQLYSFITVKCTSGWNDTFQLVPPHEENIKKNRFSVVSSLGASFIGHSEGDSIRYGLPGNTLSIKIGKVAQTEEKVSLDNSQENLKTCYPNRIKIY